MTPSLRSARRALSSRPMNSIHAGKENLDTQAQKIGPPRGDAQESPSNKKSRHRLSTFQLNRLEDTFKQQTHPNRQQKRDLAVELGMNYKTITIWFQNRRQTSKRNQPPTPERAGQHPVSGRTKADSSLRTVSSPSHNATLQATTSASDVDSESPVKRRQSKNPMEGLSAVASKAMKIIKMKPLLDSLNIMTSKPIELMSGKGSDSSEAANHENAGDTQPLMVPEDDASPPDSDSEMPANEEPEMVVQEPAKEELVGWKRSRTLEWACERQTKRRKLTKEGYARLGSEDPQDSDQYHDDLRTESALSLLSLASAAQVRPSKDVMIGAALLINLKNSWNRK